MKRIKLIVFFNILSGIAVVLPFIKKFEAALVKRDFHNIFSVYFLFCGTVLLSRDRTKSLQL